VVNTVDTGHEDMIVSVSFSVFLSVSLYVCLFVSMCVSDDFFMVQFEISGENISKFC